MTGTHGDPPTGYTKVVSSDTNLSDKTSSCSSSSQVALVTETTAEDHSQLLRKPEDSSPSDGASYLGSGRSSPDYGLSVDSSSDEETPAESLSHKANAGDYGAIRSRDDEENVLHDSQRVIPKAGCDSSYPGEVDALTGDALGAAPSIMRRLVPSLNDMLIYGGFMLNVGTKGTIACFETLGAAYAVKWFGMTTAEAGATFATFGGIGVVTLLSMRVACRYFNDVQLVLGGVCLMTVTCLILGAAADAGGIRSFFAAVFFMYSVGYPIGHTAVSSPPPRVCQMLSLHRL